MPLTGAAGPTLAWSADYFLLCFIGDIKRLQTVIAQKIRISAKNVNDEKYPKIACSTDRKCRNSLVDLK